MRRNLLTTLVVAITALIAVLATRGCGGGSTGSNNAGTNKTPANKPCGIKFERGPLADLPTLDPIYYWPPDNSRMAWEQFWGVWQTSEHSPSRMLLSADGNLWHAFGDSTATTHDRLVDLAQFDSKVQFCVEFEEKGVQYRSRIRTATFGHGVHFKDREVRMRIEAKPDQRQEIELIGANPAALPTDDFKLALVPEGMRIYFSPLVSADDKGGRVLLIVDGATVPQPAGICYLQLADRKADTLDRVKIVVEAR